MVFRKNPRKPLRKRKARKAPKKALTKLIQKIIHKDVETKQASVNWDLTAYNSGINVGGDTTKLIPSIAQGTDNGQRVGDNIRGMSLTVRGHLLLALPATNVSSNCRIGVRLMVVQPKRYNNEGDCVTYYNNWMPYLLDNGTNSQGFTGLIQDLYLPINRDAITVYYDKVHYLSSPFIQTVGTPGYGIISEEIRNTVKFFNLKVAMKNKLLKYQDGTNTPLNFAPMIILGYSHLDGSAPDVVTAQVSMAFNSVFKYEDA